MNYSAEANRIKISVFRELRETLESEIARIDTLLLEWEGEPIEDDKGEVIPFANYLDFELKRK